jgi:dihydroorotase
MSTPFDLLLHGGHVFTPSGLVEVDLGLRDGKIAAVGALDGAAAATRFDLRGLVVLPGVIDSQVHFREPGLTHKEDLASGTAAAAQGGVTAVMEMPNTSPSTTTAAALEDKLARAAGRAWVDHAFFVGASAENVGQLAVLERLPGCAGIKVFMGSSTGSLLVSDDETLRAVLADGQRRVAIHAEDEPRLIARRPIAEAAGHARAHHQWRDEETARLATERVLRLARQTGRRVHILHVTTADELPLLEAHRDLATMEVTPNHLFLAAPDCTERLGSLAQMNPPVREAHHRAALWEAVQNGLVDVVGSDHAPHTREEKARPYPQSPSGMPGVQTLLPLLLDAVNQGLLTLPRLVDLTSAGPARIYGLVGKGRIALGYDADLTVVDLAAARTITDGWIASKVGWTPFHGRPITGWPVATVVRGQIVMRDGELLGRPIGAPLRFA